jgi:Zn finger protein HypA/HybF involved in hydrogenase expression
MHESAVAQSVLEQILAEAEKHNARPKSARISCGQFNALNDEAMQVAFEAAAMGTPCQGMKLASTMSPRTLCKSWANRSTMIYTLGCTMGRELSSPTRRYC